MRQEKLTGEKLLLIRSTSSSGRQEICGVTGTGMDVVEHVNGKAINHALHPAFKSYVSSFMTD